ncbi:putative disease resistance protein RGA3 [Carex rostrata]
MESALISVAQWAGSAIITKLIETAYSYLGKRMLPADTESQLSRLKEALPKVAAVMGVAEMLKFKYPNSAVEKWLENFKEAFLAAEDVVDELKYRELEDKLKKRDQVSGSKLDWLKSKIHISCHGCCRGYTIGEDTFRLREAVKMLDLVATGVGDFFHYTTTLEFHGLAKPNNQPINTSSRETTSLLPVSNVFGRENEKAMIIEWLKKPASHGNISAFCIVGLGGLGKTTLAQLISEEISKENYFDKTIWVCVSTSFSVEDITRKILEDLGEKTHYGESLNGLQKSLKEKILSKKFFLILDDVWNDDNMCDWEKLIVPLEYVQQGSKILLTTRMKLVADMLACVLNVERENLLLEGLKEQELLQLFNKYAFSGYNPDNHKDLQKIGNDIVKKLRDSPLAAKVIGSLLNSDMNIHYWKRILNKDSLINLEQAKDVADVLKLSYYHLPAHLQECFRFCCIFPQDYEFDKDELIKLWTTSSFIRQELHGEESPEDICEEYFNNLFRKSFFERSSWNDNTYVMHDLMHDLARNVSEGECCRVEPNGKSDNIPITAQHVSVPEIKIERILNLRNLRTLVITLSEDNINRDRFVLPNGSLKETLRLLVIQGGICELPEEIGSLLHLRFLKVNLYKLPNSINKLYQLQVLEMSYKYRYSHIEGVEIIGMTNLVSLRYIELPDEVMQNIHGIHKLTSLQELKFFVGRKSGHHIDELQTLNNLRSLSILNLENVENPIEAMNANLSKKESLISLFLFWTESNSDNPEQEQVIDNLQPHPNLKELEITGYAGHKYPIWMKDSSHLDLSSLTFDDCRYCEALPFLGKMPYLKELSLSQMFEVKEVDYSCDSTSDCAFPSLEQLFCWNMPTWESWAGPLSCYGFPNLKELLIVDCLNLAKLPAIPFSLMEFEIENVGLNSLPDMHYGSSITDLAPSYMKSSLKVVAIINCPKLISLDGFLQQQNLDLQAVERLTIKGCENLLQLPKEGFGKLMSLKNLTIENNPKLAAVDFWRNLIPVKLQTLTMGNCGELDVPLLEASFCLTNLTELRITGSFSIIDVALSDLPEYFQSSCSDGPTSSSLTASLRYVEISRCSHLASLNGFLLQENIDLSGLEELTIRDCENLVQLPTDAVGKFVSLKQLIIRGCPKLVELASMHQANTVNPGNNLASLKINYLEVDHLCLLLIEPLRSFRFVSSLTVGKCSGLEALPEQWLLQNSSTLRKLVIWDASSLRSLPGTMVMLTFLERLDICNASLLEEIPELPTSLKRLHMDNASSLRSLPGTMVMLTSLERLHIYNAPLLEEIPELPTSLIFKDITRE